MALKAASFVAKTPIINLSSVVNIYTLSIFNDLTVMSRAVFLLDVSLVFKSLVKCPVCFRVDTLAKACSEIYVIVFAVFFYYYIVACVLNFCLFHCSGCF